MNQYVRSKKLYHFLMVMLIFNISVGMMFANYLPAKVCNAVRIPLVLYMLTYININLPNVKNGLARLSVVLLSVCIVYIIFHNFGDTMNRFGWHFVDCQGFLAMLFLLMVPAFAAPRHLPYILTYSMLGVYIYAGLFILKIPQVISLFLSGEIVGSHTIFEGLHTYIGGGLIFLILFQDYFSAKKKRWINGLAVCSILAAAILGRRGILLIYIIVYTLYTILHIKNKSRHRILVTILIAAAAYAFAMYIMSVGEQYFPFLFQRMTDDTRSMTQDELLFDLGRTGDMLLGRGLAGSYDATSLDDKLRTGIETGYLNMVLKGGWVYVCLYTLFVSPAILLGLFKSKNSLVRAMAVYAIVWVFYFNTASSNLSASIRYFFFLYCIYICYNPKYRKMNEEQMQKELGINGKL